VESQPTQDKDKSAASLRRGGKAVISAEQDEQANLPETAAGEVSPTVSSMGGGLLPSEGRAASCLNPTMCAFHAHPGLVWMMRALKLASLMEADFPRDLRRTAMRIRCRSNARTHYHMPRLASLKASARVQIPHLPLNLPVFERYNRAILLRMRCLGSPTDN
jgi:hypothetical protein